MGKPKYAKSVGYHLLERQSRNERIVRLVNAGRLSKAEVGRMFGISAQAIRKICQPLKNLFKVSKTG